MKFNVNIGESATTFTPHWWHMFIAITEIPATLLMFLSMFLIIVINILYMDTCHIVFHVISKKPKSRK